MKFEHLKAGDSVYIRHSWYRQSEGGRLQTVTKVVARSGGFYVDGDRYDMRSGVQTNSRAGSPAQAWLDEADYRAELNLRRMWSQFKSRLQHSPPPDMTPARLQELSKELIGGPLISEDSP